MNRPAECAREGEVLAAIRMRRLPMSTSTDAVATDATEANKESNEDSELAAHINACAVCREVAAIAELFSNEQMHTRDAHVPSAAHVWWRAQIRARQEAARTATRPLTIAQGFGAAAAAGLGAAAVTIGLRNGWPFGTPQVSPGVAGQAREMVDYFAGLAVRAPEATVVFAAIAACLMLMPVIVYFALGEK